MTGAYDIGYRMVDGIEFAERPGDGPSAILLHGIGSNAGSFAPLISALPQDWRIIAWNAPGYGRSDPLDRDWPLARDYAARLDDLLGAVQISRFTLLGHSLGTLIAAAFARNWPGRIERLMLASPALGHGVQPGDELSTSAKARLDDLDALGPRAFAAARALRLVFEPERNATVVVAVQAAMAKVQPRGYGQAVRMLASGRLLDDLEGIAVRTDVIVGAEDRITPPAGARSAHEAVPERWRGAMAEVPKAGHALPQENTAAVAALFGRVPESVR